VLSHAIDLAAATVLVVAASIDLHLTASEANVASADGIDIHMSVRAALLPGADTARWPLTAAAAAYLVGSILESSHSGKNRRTGHCISDAAAMWAGGDGRGAARRADEGALRRCRGFRASGGALATGFAPAGGARGGGHRCRRARPVIAAAVDGSAAATANEASAATEGNTVPPPTLPVGTQDAKDHVFGRHAAAAAATELEVSDTLEALWVVDDALNPLLSLLGALRRSTAAHAVLLWSLVCRADVSGSGVSCVEVDDGRAPRGRWSRQC
jgi:hypothetical protein